MSKFTDDLKLEYYMPSESLWPKIDTFRDKLINEFYQNNYTFFTETEKDENMETFYIYHGIVVNKLDLEIVLDINFVAEDDKDADRQLVLFLAEDLDDIELKNFHFQVTRLGSFQRKNE